MLFFRVCFTFIKLFAGNGFFFVSTSCNKSANDKLQQDFFYKLVAT